MDTETLYTATKWDILKILEQRPQSPLEIANALQSSLANISQQLRLLEMAGVVASSRVSNRDKGQPRVLYRIAGDLSYLIATSGGFVEKKAVRLSSQNKVVLRIWFLDDPQVRYALEKAFWAIENRLIGVKKIAFAGIINGTPVLDVEGGKLPSKIEVGGSFGFVTVHQTKTPAGHILYAEE